MDMRSAFKWTTFSATFPRSVHFFSSNCHRLPLDDNNETLLIIGRYYSIQLMLYESKCVAESGGPIRLIFNSWS